ncbi:MAG TPA: pyruvate kinase [Candidatus Rifleibacterium sp.]|nr:pyruvate kinase [Candidatus Rifleibacterium sp.]HPT44947.1 pyruvate kinase [Candidatus Rifleibacterium sp.]
MRKTKILVTLGPSAEEESVLRELIEAGMNVARLNFSHGDYEEHGGRVATVKKLREEMKMPVALMLDTKGPEIRTGLIEGDRIHLEAGKQITLTTDTVTGNAELLSISFDRLPSMIETGSTILLDDGLIQLTVEGIPDDRHIICKIVNSGSIKSRRGVNVPKLQLNMSNPTPKDRDDIIFAARNDFDFIAVSFSESEDTIRRVRAILDVEGKPDIKVIAKIENHAGLKNFNDILEVADGIMVARGDLGVELLPEEVPIVQKEIIRRCYMAGKPVITATQMLHTMIESPRPTRAEVSDVANAVYDFTSAIMLSGETSIGKYPVECVKLMDRVSRNTEDAIDYKRIYNNFAASEEFSDRTSAVTNAAIATAYNLHATAIITVTETGRTAQALSKLRPSIPIIAVVSNQRLYNQLSINWGIIPILGSHFKSIEELYRESVRLSLATGIISDGDTIILIAGIPVGRSGGTNMIKVETVGHAGHSQRRRREDETSEAKAFSLGQEKSSHNHQLKSGGTPLDLLTRPVAQCPHRY